MLTQPLIVLIFLLLFLLLVVITQWLYISRIAPEKSRKFIHVSGGILALFLPLCIQSHWWILLLCGSSFLLLLFTYLFKQLPGIHKTKRYSLGSLFFPIPVYVCFLVAVMMGNFLLFYIPISLLTFSDTAAEWGGKQWGRYTRSFFQNQKTMAGSLCFALSAWLICLLWLAVLFHLPFHHSLIIGFLVMLAATIAEALSLKGWDNLTIPAAAAGTLYLLLQTSYFSLPPS
jgi:phytol kinase